MDRRTGETIGLAQRPPGAPIMSVAVTPRMVPVSSTGLRGQKRARVVGTLGSENQLAVFSHYSSVGAVAVTPDGSRFVTGSNGPPRKCGTPSLLPKSPVFNDVNRDQKRFFYSGAITSIAITVRRTSYRHGDQAITQPRMGCSNWSATGRCWVPREGKCHERGL